MDTSLRAAVSLLDGLGCRLAFTDSMMEAKILFRTLPVAGIVLDISGSPEKAMSQIRDLCAANNKQAAMIIISSAVDLYTAQRMFKYGAVDILVKPVSAQRLRSGVMGACAKAGEKGIGIEGEDNVVMLLQYCDDLSASQSLSQPGADNSRNNDEPAEPTTSAPASSEEITPEPPEA
jgi:FixJ family two-component response regulator